MEAVALEALANREPSRLTWSVGELGFAKNRRTEGGPVDHSLPCLQVRDLDGHLRAVWASYACHCTTLAGTDNHICGDWAGYAQEAIQNTLPDVTALITIGCGADANPESRMMPMPDGQTEVFNTRLAYAKAHGEALSAEVQRLLISDTTPLPSVRGVHLNALTYPLIHYRRVRSGRHALLKADRLPIMPESILKPCSEESQYRLNSPIPYRRGRSAMHWQWFSLRVRSSWITRYG